MDEGKIEEKASEPEDDSSVAVNPHQDETRTLVGLDCTSIDGIPYADRPIGSSQLALMQCIVVRETNFWGDRQLTLESCATGRKLLVAQRVRSGNYHIFDVSRGTVGVKLKKKSGNYIGKITGDAPHNRLLFDNTRKERALFIHRRTRTFAAIVDGAKPRQICVVLPTTGCHQKSDLLKRFFVNDSSLIVLNQRQPKLLNGQYSLNFHGRATVPSVKNCQLVSDHDPNGIALQLGKVATNTFNLDFATPFTPFTAFAIAICQFLPS